MGHLPNRLLALGSVCASLSNCGSQSDTTQGASSGGQSAVPSDGSDHDADPNSDAVAGQTADHRVVAAFDSIPADVVAQVADMRIFYGHNSYGGQLLTGVDSMGQSYHFTDLTEHDGDLYEDWVTPTEAHLADHPDTQVVIWAWCWQVPQLRPDQVQAYFNDMETLEQAYPNTRFVYMTGHLRNLQTDDSDYSDEMNQTLQENNQVIRDHCRENAKWLYDFGDIEAYLDGATEPCLYHDMPTECAWPSAPSGECAHSFLPNCIRKGKAFYWLLARMTGWGD